MENLNRSNNYSIKVAFDNASLPLASKIYDALCEAEIALKDGHSALAEEKLNAVARQVVISTPNEASEYLKILVNYKNPIICHRMCLALLQAVCEDISGSREIQFLQKFDYFFPKLEINVRPEEITTTWGVNSMSDFAKQVLAVNGQQYLFDQVCWPLCRQVGIALFEWGKEACDRAMPTVAAACTPSKEHSLRVQGGLDDLSPESLKSISSGKDFDSLIDKILGKLTPPSDEVESELSAETKQEVELVWSRMKQAAGLLGNDLLKVSSFQKIDPSSKLHLQAIVVCFNRLTELKKLIEGEYVDTFAGYYMMDELDSLLQDVFPNGLRNTIGGLLFRYLAQEVYNIMKVAAPPFIKEIDRGLAINQAMFAAEIFEDLKNKKHALKDHIVSQIQASYIDWIFKSGNEKAHIKLGWTDLTYNGHFMWGVVKDWSEISKCSSKPIRQYQLKIINTGYGNHYHDFKPSPSGKGEIRALTRTSRVFNTQEMRTYLKKATQFSHPWGLDRYIRQKKIKENTADARSKIALSANYDGLGWGDGDEIYTKGQRSETCIVKGCKGIARTEDPSRYPQLHLFSKMLVFSTYYKRLEALGCAEELEIELKRTLAKEVFFRLDKQGAEKELLETLAEHVILSESWKWACEPIIKRVYSGFIEDGNVSKAKNWLAFIYDNDFALALQCSAETIDAYVDGGLGSFDIVADAFELLTKYNVEPEQTYYELEQRCVNLDRFPWMELKVQNPELCRKILAQISQSGYCKEAHEKLRKAVSTQTCIDAEKANLSKVG